MQDFGEAAIPTKPRGALKQQQPRSAPRRTNVVPLLDISSDRLRNLVRGALSAENAGAFAKTMATLHLECGPSDAVAVGKALQAPYAKHGVAPAAFPESGVDEAETPYYASKRLDLELALQRDRLHSETTKLVAAIEAIGRLNAAILSYDAPLIESMFREYRENFGLSLMVALKAISLRNIYRPLDRLSFDDLSAVEPFLRPVRQVAVGAFEGTSDKTSDYLRIRRSFVNFVERNRLNHADAAIVTDMLTPLKIESFDLAHRLQAFGRRGVVDTTAFLFRAKSILLDEGRTDEAASVDETLPEEVREAWQRTFCGVEVGMLQDLVGRPDQFFDAFLYSHLPAWSEYPTIYAYRLGIEAAIGARLDGRHSLAKKVAAPIVRPRATAEELLEEPEMTGLPAGVHVPVGGFHRTIALIGSVEQAMLERPDGETLYKLLDRTVDVAFLLTAQEIETLLPTCKEDLLYEYLRAALLNDCEGGPKRNHAVRRALQELVQRQYDGDIVRFMNSVNSVDGHVAQHFFNLCSETFLTSLYALYPNADGVMEAQTNLLEWWAENEDDEEAALRARSHRLLIRLRKVRGSIDSTRIYVDPLRLIEWMHDDLEDELRAIVPLADEILADPSETLNLNDHVGAKVQPRLRLLKLLDRAYHEFCTNKVHGAASYIARRVRHGALHGHLVVELRPAVERMMQEFKEAAPEFSDYLKRWLRRFDESVKDFVKSRVHVRTTGKPRGMIEASLKDPEKANVIQVAIYAVATVLREKPQMTQATAFILDYCWHFLEVDLKRARAAIEELRREFLISVDSHMTDRSDVDTRITDSIRELNATMVSKFDVAKSWLTRPTNFSPSASVALMFQAVLDEVKQRYPCNPSVDLNDSGDIDLIGHRFHFIYDALYILIVNAAKYGKPETPLTVSAGHQFTEDGRFIYLSVTVGSEIVPAERAARTAEIEAAMNAEVGEAMDQMDLDEQSGIPKLKGLVAVANEIVGFSHHYEENTVQFTIEIRFART